MLFYSLIQIKTEIKSRLYFIDIIAYHRRNISFHNKLVQQKVTEGKNMFLLQELKLK